MSRKVKSNSMEERLGRLGARLDELMRRAEKTGDYAKKINTAEILRQKAEVEKKLKELRLPARRAWKEIQDGFSTAWDEVRGAFTRAKGKFGK
jgi:hypothetical protein